MKLELKHLAPYLPYNVKVQYIGEDRFWLKNGDVTTLMPSEIDMFCKETEFKPILRPLSDLTKEIEHNGEKFVPIEKMYNTGMKVVKYYEDFGHYLMAQGSENAPVIFDIRKDISTLKVWQYNMLVSWHFDIFGLIPKGLAIDINK